tara:strand:+ start:1348 stop:1581 length:234 start_codon:yes stop_codon:yes gene_type:complete
MDSRKVLDSIGDFSTYDSFVEKVALSSCTLVFYFVKAVFHPSSIRKVGEPIFLKSQSWTPSKSISKIFSESCESPAG